MTETLEMKDLDLDGFEEREEPKEEETDFGGGQPEPLPDFSGDMIDFLTDSVAFNATYDVIFLDRQPEYKKTVELFDKLELENECKNPNFVKWLMDEKSFYLKWIAWG